LTDAKSKQESSSESIIKKESEKKENQKEVGIESAENSNDHVNSSEQKDRTESNNSHEMNNIEDPDNQKNEDLSEDYHVYLDNIKGKKKKQVKFDEMYEKEMEIAQDEWLSMMVYCPICKNNIFAWYRKSVIEKATSYPVYIVWVHGEPNHGLLYRVDKDFLSRGEKPVIIEYDPDLYQGK
jgi:hypothetical protein